MQHTQKQIQTTFQHYLDCNAIAVSGLAAEVESQPAVYLNWTNEEANYTIPLCPLHIGGDARMRTPRPDG